MRNETIGHTLVVSSEDYRIILVLESHLIEVVHNLGLLVKNCRDCLIDCPAAHLRCLLLDTTIDCTVSHKHIDLRLIKKKIASMYKRIGQSFA